MIWAQREMGQGQKNKFLQAKRKIKLWIETYMKRVLPKRFLLENSLLSKINWVSLTHYQTKWSVMKNLWDIFLEKSRWKDVLLWEKFLIMSQFSKPFKWLNKISVQRILINVMAHAAPNCWREKMKATYKNLRSWGQKLIR